MGDNLLNNIGGRLQNWVLRQNSLRVEKRFPTFNKLSLNTRGFATREIIRRRNTNWHPFSKKRRQRVLSPTRKLPRTRRVIIYFSRNECILINANRKCTRELLEVVLFSETLVNLFFLRKGCHTTWGRLRGLAPFFCKSKKAQASYDPIEEARGLPITLPIGDSCSRAMEFYKRKVIIGIRPVARNHLQM